MKTTKDINGSLLDNTLILYGSACSTTHNARNYPLILAGGSELELIMAAILFLKKKMKECQICF